MRHKSEAPGSQITVRGLEPELLAALQQMATAEGLSLNQAALKMLRQGAGLPRARRRRIGNALDRFIGTLSDEEAEEFKQAIAPVEQIDESFWQ